MKIKKQEIFFWLGIILFLLRTWINVSQLLERLSGFVGIITLLSYLCFLINILVNLNKESIFNIRKIHSFTSMWIDYI